VNIYDEEDDKHPCSPCMATSLHVVILSRRSCTVRNDATVVYACGPYTSNLGETVCWSRCVKLMKK